MNDFEIISKLGKGSYSTVYKVKRLVDNNIYALKKVQLLKMNEKDKTYSLNEVRLLASIKSNYLISYKEAFFDELDNTLCLVMEFADDGDLLSKLNLYKKEHVYLKENYIWNILIQILKGLNDLHQLNIVHRDLKCANIFLFKNGFVKIGDLNVSKVIYHNLSLNYTQVGTPYYAAPEVWGKKSYNMKTDMWSLGCILFELMSLRKPFESNNIHELYNKIINCKLSYLPKQYSNELNYILQYLLKIDPDKRPSCQQLLYSKLIRVCCQKYGIENIYSDINLNKEDTKLLNPIFGDEKLEKIIKELPKPNYDTPIKIKRRMNKSNDLSLINNSLSLNKNYIAFKINAKQRNINHNKNPYQNYIKSIVNKYLYSDETNCLKNIKNSNVNNNDNKIKKIKIKIKLKPLMTNK